MTTATHREGTPRVGLPCHRGVLGCCLVLGLWPVVAVGGSEREAAAPAGTRLEVSLRDNVPPPVVRQLLLGRRLAEERLRESAPCRTLFERLGSDGPSTLSRDRYGAGEFDSERHRCPRGAAAITSVGSFEVRLCPAFGLLPATEAAVILIHEALHSAGMREKPPDPAALTPQAINTLVRTSCEL